MFDIWKSKAASVILVIISNDLLDNRTCEETRIIRYKYEEKIDAKVGSLAPLVYSPGKIFMNTDGQTKTEDLLSLRSSDEALLVQAELRGLVSLAMNARLTNLVPSKNFWKIEELVGVCDEHHRNKDTLCNKHVLRLNAASCDTLNQTKAVRAISRHCGGIVRH